MKYRWSLAPPQPVLAKVLAQQLKIAPLLAQCLLNRGLSEPGDIARFLEPRLKNLADPFLLPNMEAAVQRLWRALERHEPVVIFGDYDVDGVSASALLLEVMGALGWNINCYLPHRLEEGYGLSQAAVENCLGKYPARLLLAVDCGSTSTRVIESLQQQGIDVLVLDHHQVTDPPPQPIALINPRLPLAGRAVPNPPFQELCSAGLAFKLAHALLKRGRALGLSAALAYDIRLTLDLAVLGTIADVVPLGGENRILVSAGLARLNQTGRPGLLALKEVAGVTGPISGYEVGFQLAPRLNAAGRLETALDALRLLQAGNLTEAQPLARRLDAQNRERQEIERKIAAEVIETVRARFNPESDFVIVEGHESWHIGVVGIVASRVLQEFYRPTIILGGDGSEWRGSGRSIEGFDLAVALGHCHELLIRHGGHSMAAGLAMQPHQLEPFRTRLNEFARRTLKPELLQPLLVLDAESSPSALSWELVKELQKLNPIGTGNPPVNLLLRNVGHQRALQRMGPDKKHAKFWITDGRATREAVLWGVGDGSLPVGRFDLACTPQLNLFNGSYSIQLKVLDWRPATEC